MNDALTEIMAAATWFQVKEILARVPRAFSALKSDYPDEYKRIGRLKGELLRTPGSRVKYVGKDATLAEQYGGLDLVVDKAKWCYLGFYEVSCTMPGGGFTSWLKLQDLEAIL